MTKLLKKSLAVVLSVALCLSVMVCGFVASADGEPTITLVADNATPAAGDTVKIDVKVANFDDVAGAQFTVDLGGLEYVSVASDAIEDIDAFTNVVDGDVRLVNEYMNDADAGYVDISAANGVLFTITATVPANAAAEDAFTVDFANAKFCEYGEGEPEVDVKAESVTLTVPAAGPVEPTEPDARLAPAYTGTFLATGAKLGFFYTFYFDETLIASLDYEFDTIALKLESPEVDVNTFNLTGNTKTAIIDSSYDDTIFDDTAVEFGYHSYGITYTDTAMYEMMIPVTPTVLLYNDGILVAYYTFEAETLQDVALNYYETSTETYKKAFVVDFLNMGTAAQDYFANEKKTPGTTYIGTLDFPNDTDKIDASLATEYEFDAEDKEYTTNANNYEITPFLEMGAAPAFFYAVYDADWTTPSDLTFNISYSSKVDGDISESFNGADTPDGAAGGYGELYGSYSFSYSKVGLYDGNKPITLTVSDTNGTSYYYTRTLDSFLAESLETTDSAKKLYSLFDAVAAFSASTRVFWPAF